MHDPFLKSVFADLRMVGILIRRHVPEWADQIDVATLREEPNELVAGKTLERRCPDLIWSAETIDGGRVLSVGPIPSPHSSARQPASV